MPHEVARWRAGVPHRMEYPRHELHPLNKPRSRSREERVVAHKHLARFHGGEDPEARLGGK